MISITGPELEALTDQSLTEDKSVVGVGNTPKIAVVIPCFKVARQLNEVVTSLPAIVSRIIIVDDCCPEGSAGVACQLAVGDDRIQTIRHSCNTGVGGAVVSGYKAGLETDCDIFVKIDGDGQMDPSDLPRIIQPILDGRADYVKGNRFRDFQALKKMPRVRLLGNSMLSFLVKIASGYWNIMDPTNGYTAISRAALEQLDLDALSERYFFESDMLIQLSVFSTVVTDIPTKARYGDEPSSMSIGKVLLEFPGKLIKGLIRRVFLKYFIYDFNMASVYILLGLPLLCFGTVFGVYHWLDSFLTGAVKSAGTIMLAALPVILAFQMLLQAIQIDIDRVPRRKRD